MSCTDVGEIKCLSYQKRTPREKSPDHHTRDGTSICCVTHSKQATCVSANSGFIPTSRKFAYSNDSLTLQKRKKLTKLKTPNTRAPIALMNHRKPGEVGISGMQRLWYFAALLIALAGISPFLSTYRQALQAKACCDPCSRKAKCTQRGPGHTGQ